MNLNTLLKAFYFARLFSFLMLFILPAVTQAQFSYVTNADGISLTITAYTGSDVVANIPDSINGFSVVSIGIDAFEDMKR